MYEQLRTHLNEMIALLDSDSCAWAGHFRKALSAYDREDYEHCSYIILSGSGGMGSLNDLVLGQTCDVNGSFKWKDGYVEMNEKFQQLLESLYSFAHAYQRAAKRREHAGRRGIADDDFTSN